jgi:hypothetical protein
MNNTIDVKLAMYKKEISDTEKSLEIISKRIENNSTKVNNIDESIFILTTVLSITQEEIVTYIENVVTTALQYVYGDEYSFKIDYLFKRGQSEVEMYPIKNGLRYEPKFSCGVGVLDVCAFALRCACWSLIEPQPASVMVMDEPFKNLHGIEENEKIGLMIKEISMMLKLQIILISGESPIIKYANKSFIVKIKEGVSYITEVK